MKNIYRYLFSTLLVLFVFSIPSFAQIYWKQLADFPGEGKERVNSFSIGEYVYVGGGRMSIVGGSNEWWSFHPATGIWAPIKSFPSDPGIIRSVSFDNEEFGYVGLGYDTGTGDLLKDMWRYDPQADEWEPMSPFSGEGILNATRISGADKCYVAFGAIDLNVEDYSREIWAYTPDSDSWELVTEIPSFERYYGIGFVKENKLYVGLGGTNDAAYRDFWEYDLDQATWTQKADFPTDYSLICQSFDIDGNMYVQEGINNENRQGDKLFRYDSEKDEWINESNFLGTKRVYSFAEVLNGKGYFGWGINNENMENRNDVFSMELVTRAYEKDFSVSYEESCPTLLANFEDLGTDVISRTWTFQGGVPANSDLKDPFIGYPASGSYDVSLVVELADGPAFIEKKDAVVVRDVPVPSATFEEDIQVVTFTNTTFDGQSYLWSFGDGTTSTEENPVHLYDFAGTHLVNLLAINDCGERSTIFLVKTTGTTSTDEVGKNLKVSINPNPSSDLFHVSYELEEPVKYGRFVLFNLNGQQVFSKEINAQKGTLTIDEDLANGMYFLKLENSQFQSPPIKLIKTD